MAKQQYDPSRSLATQPYRTTRAAQAIARRIGPRTSYQQLPEPQPPAYRPAPEFAQAFRRAIQAGHTTAEAVRIARVLMTLRPLADVLSPRTRETLDAIDGGRTSGRR